MILIDGKKAASELREELKIEVSELKSKYNKVPGLTVILLLLIWFIEMCMKLYIAPILFN